MNKLWLGAGALVIVSVLGLSVGIAAGLWIGWVAWPVQITNVDIADLKGHAQEEYIALIAQAYAYDPDLPRARERLAQLNDPKITERVAALAKSYAAQDDPAAVPLAVLAAALGSRDAEIARLAATATPTPERVEGTLSPTPTETHAPTLTRIPTAAMTPTTRATPTRTATRRPSATATPKPVPAPATQWIPSFPAEWPGGVKFEPANVAPGQKYWHLARALYCDLEETRFDCPNLPGGSHGIGVWVTLVNGKAPLILDGSPANLEDKSSDRECQCTYTLDFPGPAIQVGNYPSDKISGLALKSVRVPNPNTHVRYFLTFQLVTR